MGDDDSDRRSQPATAARAADDDSGARDRGDGRLRIGREAHRSTCVVLDDHRFHDINLARHDDEPTGRRNHATGGRRRLANHAANHPTADRHDAPGNDPPGDDQATGYPSTDDESPIAEDYGRRNLTAANCVPDRGGYDNRDRDMDERERDDC